MTKNALEQTEVFEPVIDGYSRLVVAPDKFQNEESWGEKFTIHLDPLNQIIASEKNMLSSETVPENKISLAVQQDRAQMNIGENIPDWLSEETNVLIEDFLADSIYLVFFTYPVLDLEVTLPKNDRLTGEWAGEFCQNIAQDTELPVQIIINPNNSIKLRFHRNNLQHGGFPHYVEPS